MSQVKVQKIFTEFLWKGLRHGRPFSEKREHNGLVVRLTVIINVLPAPSLQNSLCKMF